MLCLLIASVDAPEEKRKIEQLYEKYNRLMYSIAYKSLRNSYDAEDAVFSSWEKVIKNIDKIGEVDAPETKGFLVVVVKHTIIDMCRKKKKMGEVSLDELEGVEAVDSDVTAHETMEAMEMIDKLPQKYKEVLILFYCNELSIKEIAVTLGLREGSVASRLSRARKMVMEQEVRA